MPSGSTTMALVGLFAGARVYGGREGVNSNPAITGDIILSSRVRLRVEPSSSQRGRSLPGRQKKAAEGTAALQKLRRFESVLIREASWSAAVPSAAFFVSVARPTFDQ